MMNRLDAIKIIIDHINEDEFVVHANGSLSRESMFCNDRMKNFYLLGSMGLASSVGIGLALARPEKKVVVLDGDVCRVYSF